MKLKRSFTLIELLIVVGIIALLAGLITPAVITAQQKGRITQAKSDMHTILMAIKGVESTYGKILNNTGTAAIPKFEFADGKAAKQLDKTVSGIEYQYAALGQAKDGKNDFIKIDGNEIGNDAQAAYDSFIAELSDPKNGKFADSDDLNINKRRQVFLDPKPDYDPSKNYDHADNEPHLWLDPWGSRYVILLNTNFTRGIVNPADTSRILAVSAAVVSLGPNAVWNNARNVDVDFGSPDALDDDIASWHK